MSADILVGLLVFALGFFFGELHMDKLRDREDEERKGQQKKA